MTTPTSESDAIPVGDIVLRALVGQECTFARDSYAEQLVVGFGTPLQAEWPLRRTLRRHGSSTRDTALGELLMVSVM